MPSSCGYDQHSFSCGSHILRHRLVAVLPLRSPCANRLSMYKSSRRTLPLPYPVYEMLCEEREKQDLYRRMLKGSYNRKYDDYICVDQLGGLIRPNRVTQRFADLIRQYDLRKIRFHDLRHACSSLLLNKGKHDGITLKDIQVWLGHSDFSTTANTYSHLDATSKVSSLTALSGAVSLADC